MNLRKKSVSLLLAIILVILGSVTVSATAASSDFDIRDGVLVQYLGDDADVVIPSKVRTIGAQAFEGNEYIETVEIPNSVTSIGYKAFAECRNLVEINIPETIKAIPNSCFQSCTNLPYILLPRSLESIGNYAFQDCIELRQVEGPDEAKLGNSSFYPVSAHVTSVGTGAFYHCPKVVVNCFIGSAVETYVVSNNIQHVSLSPIIYGITPNPPKNPAGEHQINLINGSATMGSSYISLTIDPVLAQNNELGYSSSNVNIATVNEDGLVTAVAPGTCVITIYSYDSLAAKAKVRIVVLNPSKGFQKWGKYRYYCLSASSFATGWTSIGSHTYYFSTDLGIMYRRWNKIDGSWYYFASNGRMRTGWLTDGANRFYLGTSGAMQTGWVQLSGKWYYLEPSTSSPYGYPLGARYTNGTYSIGGKNYYFDANGVWVKETPKNGWQKEDGKYYYYVNGVKQKGWLKLDNAYYYLDPTTGAMQKGWQKIDGKTYYFRTNGQMCIGWTQIKGSWYYFEATGVRHRGWLQEGSNWYYLDKEGKMVTGKVTIDGKVYTFSSTGVLIK